MVLGPGQCIPTDVVSPPYSTCDLKCLPDTYNNPSVVGSSSSPWVMPLSDTVSSVPCRGGCFHPPCGGTGKVPLPPPPPPIVSRHSPGTGPCVLPVAGLGCVDPPSYIGFESPHLNFSISVWEGLGACAEACRYQCFSMSNATQGSVPPVEGSIYDPISAYAFYDCL